MLSPAPSRPARAPAARRARAGSRARGSAPPSPRCARRSSILLPSRISRIRRVEKRDGIPELGLLAFLAGDLVVAAEQRNVERHHALAAACASGRALRAARIIPAALSAAGARAARRAGASPRRRARTAPGCALPPRRDRGAGVVGRAQHLDVRDQQRRACCSSAASSGSMSPSGAVAAGVVGAFIGTL